MSRALARGASLPLAAFIRPLLVLPVQVRSAKLHTINMDYWGYDYHNVGDVSDPTDEERAAYLARNPVDGAVGTLLVIVRPLLELLKLQPRAPPLLLRLVCDGLQTFQLGHRRAPGALHFIELLLSASPLADGAAELFVHLLVFLHQLQRLRIQLAVLFRQLFDRRRSLGYEHNRANETNGLEE